MIPFAMIGGSTIHENRRSGFCSLCFVWFRGSFMSGRRKTHKTKLRNRCRAAFLGQIPQFCSKIATARPAYSLSSRRSSSKCKDSHASLRSCCLPAPCFHPLPFQLQRSRRTVIAAPQRRASRRYGLPIKAQSHEAQANQRSWLNSLMSR